MLGCSKWSCDIGVQPVLSSSWLQGVLQVSYLVEEQ